MFVFLYGVMFRSIVKREAISLLLKYKLLIITLRYSFVMFDNVNVFN